MIAVSVWHNTADQDEQTIKAHLARHKKILPDNRPFCTEDPVKPEYSMQSPCSINQ